MKLDIIYNEDCLKGMKRLPDESIDLVITSPPYDNLRTYENYAFFNFEGIAKELYRLIKIGGVIVWVVGDATINGSETGTSFQQALFFKSLGLNLHDTMIYEKNGSSYPLQNRYYACFEYMFIFSKERPKTVNLLRDRKNKWIGSWGKRSSRNKQGELVIRKKIPYQQYGVRFNIWRYNVGYGFTTQDIIAYKHPAIFPEKLAQDHILSWSNEGNLVLDPMFGSGTVLKMAKQLGRHYIGYEINPKYCEIARKRLEKAVYQKEFEL